MHTNTKAADRAHLRMPGIWRLRASYNMDAKEIVRNTVYIKKVNTQDKQNIHRLLHSCVYFIWVYGMWADWDMALEMHQVSAQNRFTGL